MGDIVKVLTDFDTSYQGRCILPREELTAVLSNHQREALERRGKDIDVLLIDKDDNHRNTPYYMKLSYQNSYFLKRGWTSVISNRKLVTGDAIRMSCDNVETSSSAGGGGGGDCGGSVLRFNFWVYKQSNTGEGESSTAASSSASNMF